MLWCFTAETFTCVESGLDGLFTNVEMLLGNSETNLFDVNNFKELIVGLVQLFSFKETLY